MDDNPGGGVTWTRAEVSSPLLPSVPVVRAAGIPYVANANRLQRLAIYLPDSEPNAGLVGSAVRALPGTSRSSDVPQILVHVHGGAWRDPQLTATSIEAAVAHAFAEPDGPIAAVASIDYTISAFPTHPSFPYDPVEDGHCDPAREAVHPQHVSDVISGLLTLAALGLSAGSYVLSGHSSGACTSAQAVFVAPEYFGLDLAPPPRPAAFLGLNGLYDLPALVDGLGPSHERVRADYIGALSTAFGPQDERWSAASPARFPAPDIAARVEAGAAPQVVLLDQSPRDQLVPLNQQERFASRLRQVEGIRVVDGRRCTGRHAEPWQRGDVIWDSVLDVLALLGRG